MRFLLVTLLTITCSMTAMAVERDHLEQRRCIDGLELKQSLAKILFVRPGNSEVVAEVWDRFDRVNVRILVSQFLSDEDDARFTVRRMPYLLVTWNPRTKEVRAAQAPMTNEGPAVLTRNMANIQLWFETTSGLGLTASPDKIANYSGEFLKEELNTDLGDFVWLRWDAQTNQVEAIYL